MFFLKDKEAREEACAKMIDFVYQLYECLEKYSYSTCVYPDSVRWVLNDFGLVKECERFEEDFRCNFASEEVSNSDLLPLLFDMSGECDGLKGRVIFDRFMATFKRVGWLLHDQRHEHLENIQSFDRLVCVLVFTDKITDEQHQMLQRSFSEYDLCLKYLLSAIFAYKELGRVLQEVLYGFKS